CRRRCEARKALSSCTSSIKLRRRLISVAGLFRYFARLHDRYALPVYPIVLFSYARPRRPEPTVYRVAFADWAILEFQYRVIQLNRLRWRDFVRRPNPVASALMAKMAIAPADRP